MKDERGVYYHPFPQNKRVRMYVRKGEGTVWFRLCNEEDPELWERHGWLAYEAVEEAGRMFDGKGFSPRDAYDVQVARRLLRDEDNGASA